MSKDATDGSPRMVTSEALPRRLWLVALVVGTVMWVVVAAAIVLTKNTILIPNLTLLGSFLVPVCAVLFVLARRHETQVSIETLLLGFVAGGTVGVVFTGTIEEYVLPDAALTNALIGAIEEGGKALILVAVATRVRPRVPRDGMVLGATVGAGFAAFESAGYAVGAMIQYSDDHPILNVMETEAFRAVLAPFGHITWTAILGGAIFASAWTTGRFSLDRRVLWTFVGVVVLHCLWDASYGIAIRLSEGLGGEGWQFGWPDTAAWVGSPTGTSLVRYQAIYDGLLAVVGVIGLVWALRRWRAYQPERWTHPPAEPM